MTMTSETLDMLKQAQASPDVELAKAFTQSSSATSGLTYYDLEAPAKSLFPVLTPLRNEIPRVGGKGGIQAAWRAVTGVNTTSIGMGISEGNRGGVTVTSIADYTAAYKGFGLDDSVTFEAQEAGEGFEDVRALAAENLLKAVMIGEEKLILGGNNSTALGTTPQPTLSASTSGGALAAQTWSVICVGLSFEGYLAASLANGIPLSGNRTLGDGTVEQYNGGTATQSANATVTTTGSTSSIGASVSAITGAFGYAWFWGTAGSEVLGAITTINSVSITATATGTQAASAGFGSDFSNNSLVFDGLLTQALKAGSNAYVNVLATGTPGSGNVLTTNNAGGIDEIDTALQHFWDVWRLSPTTIYVNSQEQKNITQKILTSNSTSAQRFVMDVKQGVLAGGQMVRSYFNPFTMGGAKEIPIELHPDLPPGTILFDTKELPYPMSNIRNVRQMRMRRDYYQIEWPMRTRKYELGVYADGVLQHYAPFALGVITNIGNG